MRDARRRSSFPGRLAWLCTPRRPLTMLFFSRTDTLREVPTSSLPGTVVGPDGNMSLGMPLQSIAGATTRSPAQQSSALGDASRHGTIVLMHPSAGATGSHALFALIIALDIGVCIAGSAELAWRSVRTEYLSQVFVAGCVFGALGLLASAGPLSGRWPASPRLLLLLALAGAVQFLYAALWPLSAYQLAHAMLQLVIVSQATRLRRQRMTAWYSNRRGVMARRAVFW